jgi:hypothetical protein
LSENGEKKLEALKEMDDKLRGRPVHKVIQATILPDEKPVNER